MTDPLAPSKGDLTSTRFEPHATNSHCQWVLLALNGTDTWTNIKQFENWSEKGFANEMGFAIWCKANTPPYDTPAEAIANLHTLTPLPQTANVVDGNGNLVSSYTMNQADFSIFCDHIEGARDELVAAKQKGLDLTELWHRAKARMLQENAARFKIPHVETKEYSKRQKDPTYTFFMETGFKIKVKEGTEAWSPAPSS